MSRDVKEENVDREYRFSPSTFPPWFQKLLERDDILDVITS